MPTFEDIKASVKLLPEFQHEQGIGDYLLTQAVNDAQRRFHQELNARFEQKTGTTITTTSGTRDYSLPSDYKEMQSVFYRKAGATDKTMLTRRTKEWFDAHYSDPASTGTPESWMIWAGKLRLGPTPNTTSDEIVPDYHAYKADLADGSPTNTNDFTSQFWEALRWSAAEQMALYAGVPTERVSVFSSLYAAALRRAKRVIVSEEVSGKSVVMRTPG